MAVQQAQNNSTVPFLRSGDTLAREAETILTDAGRTEDLVQYTLMSRIAASGKWVPLTDIAAVDGSAIPRGVYMGDDILAADLVAGDVVDVPIVAGGAAATYDRDQLVIENSLTLATVIGAASIHAGTVEDYLANIGLFAEYTVDITEFENA